MSEILTSPIADPSAIAADIRRIVDEVNRSAEQLPQHHEFIARYCPAGAS